MRTGMILQIKRTGSIEVPLPVYKTGGSVGLDLFAAIPHPIRLRPGDRVAVPVGFAMAIPTGFEGQVRARSGLYRHHGITLVNGVGTIDSDYRGPISVSLINLAPWSFWGRNTYDLQPGERFAQLVICPIQHVELTLVEELSETERGSAGFGSTGSS